MNSGSPLGTEGLLRVFPVVTLMHSHSVKCEHYDFFGILPKQKRVPETLCKIERIQSLKMENSNASHWLWVKREKEERAAVALCPCTEIFHMWEASWESTTLKWFRVKMLEASCTDFMCFCFSVLWWGREEGKKFHLYKVALSEFLIKTLI